MESILITCIWVVAIIAIVVKIGKKFKESRSKENAVSKPKTLPYTRNKLLDILKELGCRIQRQKDEDIHFLYQGELFWARCRNDALPIDFIDSWWYSLPLDNVDDFSMVRELVNDFNYRQPVSLFYSIDSDSNVLAVHSKQEVVLHVELSDNEKKAYIEAALHAFISVKNDFLYELDKRFLQRNTTGQ